MISKDILDQLKAALEECANLRKENQRLRALLGAPKEGSDTCSKVFDVA